MNRIPESLAKATVLDETSKPVEFGAIVRDRPTVIVFLRHFG